MTIDPLSLNADRLLVIAPHPDDESLGCGGLIAAFAGAGKSVCVVFVTDGAASHPNSREWPRERLAARRAREAEQALACLGAGDQQRLFLGLPDAAMPAPDSPDWRAARARLTETVRRFKPDLAALPWRRDPHRDHRDSWRLARDALAAADLHPVILEYAVWLDELGAPGDRPAPDEADPLAIDIAALLPAKRAAIAAHLSQTTDLITDTDGFRLTEDTIARLTGPEERYWRARW